MVQRISSTWLSLSLVWAHIDNAQYHTEGCQEYQAVGDSEQEVQCTGLCQLGWLYTRQAFLLEEYLAAEFCLVGHLVPYV